MKLTLCAFVCLLTGCGAGASFDASQQPSQQPTVECSESAECMAYGATARTCAESFFGTVMMSTWDNGKTWLIGNCDSTA